MIEQLLTTKQAAPIQGVSIAFLERDRWAGARIPFIKMAVVRCAIALATSWAISSPAPLTQQVSEGCIMWHVDIRDFRAPGAVHAEHTLQALHEHELVTPDRKWREEIFMRLPRRFAYQAAREYEEKYLFESRRNANLYLFAEQESLEQNPIPLTASDYELEQLAKKHAQEMR